ncbi:HNH endonuclease [Ensifer sp.]|uniref:HNH endonuclease n=1 Tax=Ensifer sp. TaxID=1872086 RepID=UPI00289D95BA|nr:HNH endonuclease [Ensifer sp.]
MNRKEFVQSHGADCKNWNWSWSFVNHRERFVIFGMWQSEQKNRLGCILRKNWEISAKGRKNNGYGQALEHIRLIEAEGYRLQTFPMRGVARNPQEGELSPAAIAEFTPELSEGRLVVLADGWYVDVDQDVYETIAEVIDSDDPDSGFREGAMFTVVVNGYERNADARKACLRHHGLSCKVCDVNFGNTYGALGEGYIHVHHIKPIHKCGGEYIVDPIEDLIPVCANCHAMLHRRSEPLTVDELKAILSAQRANAAARKSHTADDLGGVDSRRHDHAGNGTACESA